MKKKKNWIEKTSANWKRKMKTKNKQISMIQYFIIVVMMLNGIQMDDLDKTTHNNNNKKEEEELFVQKPTKNEHTKP